MPKQRSALIKLALVLAVLGKLAQGLQAQSDSDEGSLSSPQFIEQERIETRKVEPKEFDVVIPDGRPQSREHSLEREVVLRLGIEEDIAEALNERDQYYAKSPWYKSWQPFPALLLSHDAYDGDTTTTLGLGYEYVPDLREPLGFRFSVIATRDTLASRDNVDRIDRIGLDLRQFTRNQTFTHTEHLDWIFFWRNAFVQVEVGITPSIAQRELQSSGESETAFALGFDFGIGLIGAHTFRFEHWFEFYSSDQARVYQFTYELLRPALPIGLRWGIRYRSSDLGSRSAATFGIRIEL